MRRIIRLLRLLWSYLSFLFSRNTRAVTHDLPTTIDPRLQKCAHNCALVALARVKPDLSADQIIRGFGDCCDRWPHAGVTNKEFNITLRHLGIFDQFEYNDSERMTVKDFFAMKESVFIILTHGHFSAIVHGMAIDDFYYAGSHVAKVYCSWRLIVA